jgi:hypothetical protein
MQVRDKPSSDFTASIFPCGFWRMAGVMFTLER